MSKSDQYVGLDVSLNETSICAIDDAGRIVWRGKTHSTPKSIATAVKQHVPHAVRFGLESGQLSNWLVHELKHMGLPVICFDARHAKAVLSLKVNKKDANDARFGADYAGRLVPRGDGGGARLPSTSYFATLKNCVRGILKTFGRVLPKGLRSQFAERVRAAIDGHAALGGSSNQP
jgi:transposase